MDGWDLRITAGARVSSLRAGIRRGRSVFRERRKKSPSGLRTGRGARYAPTREGRRSMLAFG